MNHARALVGRPGEEGSSRVAVCGPDREVDEGLRLRMYVTLVREGIPAACDHLGFRLLRAGPLCFN